MGVFVLVLIIFYIEGGIYNSFHLYDCLWGVGGAVFRINVEVPINLTGEGGIT